MTLKWLADDSLFQSTDMSTAKGDVDDGGPEHTDTAERYLV